MNKDFICVMILVQLAFMVFYILRPSRLTTLRIVAVVIHVVSIMSGIWILAFRNG